MNEKLPYEEKFREGLEDLPLPSEDAAWEKMQELLDKDGGRRTPPPLFLRSCAGWALLLLLVGGSLWWLLTSDNSKERGKASTDGTTITNERTGTATSTSSEKKRSTGSKTEKNSVEQSNTSSSVKENTIQLQEGTQPVTPGGAADQQGTVGLSKKVIIKEEGINTDPAVVGTRGNAGTRKTATRKNMQAGKVATPSSARLTIGKGLIRKKNPVSETAVEATDAPVSTTTVHSSAPSRRGSLLQELSRPGQEILLDSTAYVQRPVPGTDSIAAAVKMDSLLKKKSKTSPWWLAAGIGLQQVIPVAGQSAVPYNYFGRTGSIYDYIPSVYLRLHHGNKWFLQGEFRYGAPQSVREFSFSRSTRFDTASNNMVVTSVRLKKTYYHQLPLSFNYYIRPKWSVGAGSVYNYFFGAVTEEEVKNRNVTNNTESIKTQIQNIRGYKDSFLYKTHVQFLLQTEYEWKRFTLGLRYTRDLQPYIRYTQPDGTIRDEKNQSLQFLLRFRLWKSKR